MYETARQLEQGGADIIHLEVGRPSFDTPLHIKEAAKRALDQGIVHYGDLQGTLSLREGLSRKLREYNKIDVGPDEVLVTNGLTQASFATFTATLNEGDEAIVLEPYYPQHNKKIELVGGRVVSVVLRKEDGYRIDPEAIERQVTPRTRMIVFVNPTNPTGRVFSRQEVEAVAEVARRHDLLVMTDEVYDYILYDGREHVSLASLPGMKERTISLFAFTKAYAMDGWRLGYAAGKREFIQGLQKVVLNETTHPNVFAQEGAVAAVVGSQKCVEDMVLEDRRRRDLVFERLNRMPGVKCPKPEGAIYAFPDFSALKKPSAELAEEILRHTHVATESGSFYGSAGEGHLRICFGSAPYDRLEEAMNRIEDYLRRQL
jgi:aspartate aminotransferase